MKHKPQGWRLSLLAGLAGALMPAAAYCETYTMETYYPSPAGVYNTMTVTSTTVLARDGGAVSVGTPSRPAKLKVSGAADISGVFVPGRFADDPAGPDTKIEGAVYFNTTTKKHRVYQNAAWGDMGGELLLEGSTPCNKTSAGKKALRSTPVYMPGGCLGGSDCGPAHLDWVICSYGPGIFSGFNMWLWRLAPGCSFLH